MSSSNTYSGISTELVIYTNNFCLIGAIQFFKFVLFLIFEYQPSLFLSNFFTHRSETTGRILPVFSSYIFVSFF